ncbi:translation initiation factor IF-2-like [Panicum miliaceum]|uniref:Translation initiation factor IF-2-like n=1 Tax=Panicum miliaceum TaxID=4540 RepID=A0A3L6RZ90_PANMI|nr:translation initiation factor IF-2-like [Panicum miliaceum]
MERPHQAAALAAERTMALYDACWFRRLVLLPPPAPAAPAPEREADRAPAAGPVPSSSPTAAAGAGLRHRRTRSDDATAAAFQGLEPLRLPNSGNSARLETILSGKDGLAAAAPPERRRPEARRPAGSGRRRRRRGRSMSELEFEEVKGLQDLGFTFSDAEVDAELASIVPGLRRKRSEEENRATASAPAAPRDASSPLREEAAAPAATAPRRPYLSEAWDDEEEAEVRRALRNWRIPPPGDGNDLKEHLRMWAHTVASAVR